MSCFAHRLLAPSMLAAMLTGIGIGAPSEAQDEAAEPASPLVTIEAIELSPAAPGIDTLCQLRVQLRNAGEKPISSLEVTVTVGPHELPVYANQMFMEALPPGEVTEVRLYNFWTTETGRPAPPDGKLTVGVTLRGARWLEIGADDDGTEVWKPLDEVPGLPVSRTLSVDLAK